MKLIENREEMLRLVKQNGLALEFASDNLKKDIEIVLSAIKKNYRALHYANNDMKNNKEVVLEAVKQYGRALYYASEELKNDREVVLTAVKRDGFALEYASDNLKNDKDFLYGIKDRLEKEKHYFKTEYENLKRFEREDELNKDFNEKESTKLNKVKAKI